MHPTHYVQPCPVCGRPLQIRVEYLGRQLTCNHCGGHFQAADPEAHPELPTPVDDLLHRADALLAASDLRLGETEN
jgi:hypothetical protein